MRQKIHLLFISLLITVTQPSFAQKISNTDLRKVIVKFKENNCLEAEKSEKVLALGLVKDTAIYIVEFQNGGFMIVSANYSAPPILGYCSNGIYDPKNMPEGLNYLIGTYQKNILYIKENNIKPSVEATSLWNNYLKTRNSR